MTGSNSSLHYRMAILQEDQLTLLRVIAVSEQYFSIGEPPEMAIAFDLLLLCGLDLINVEFVFPHSEQFTAIASITPDGEEIVRTAFGNPLGKDDES